MTGDPGLDSRFALVIGGTSELGLPCVARLCDEGMAVAFTGSDPERGEALARRTGATFMPCEVTDRPGMDAAVQQALTLAGDRMRVLVTLSDLQLAGPIETTSETDFRRVVEADLTMVFRTARACWRALCADGGGSMIHVGSDAGIRAAHEYGAFSVASAGVIAVAELFAAEGAPHGVRANAVCPGAWGPEANRGGSALGEEVASTVSWLASAHSAGVSGATLRVDAGAGAAMVIYTRS